MVFGTDGPWQLEMHLPAFQQPPLSILNWRNNNKKQQKKQQQQQQQHHQQQEQEQGLFEANTLQHMKHENLWSNEKDRGWRNNDKEGVVWKSR